MEELKQLCELGFGNITLASHWDELEEAKKLLTSKGYVESDDVVEDCSILFTKADADWKIEPVLLFPDHEVSLPQYIEGQRSGTSTSPALWRDLQAFQHIDQKMRVKVQIPKLQGPEITTEQTIGIKMLVQPSVMFDEVQFYIKVSVESLVVGVHPDHFLKPDKFQCLGYYPDFIRVELEPEIDGQLCAIPILAYKELQMVVPSSSAVKKTSATVVRGKVGYGPAKFQVEHSWNTEKEVSTARTELVPIEEAGGGNSANFEWTILRWKDGKKYNPKKPHSVVGFPSLKPPELPFKGTAASLSGFPDIIWKLPPEFRDVAIRFRIRLQIQMRLSWFLGNRFCRSIDSAPPSSFQYENCWVLKA